MNKTFHLSRQTISSSLESLRNVLKQKNWDALYISSFDEFLNEYVPLPDNLRFYVTGFTGSMAEALILKEGKVRLYVDGRYHEQADQEVDLQEIEVVKVSSQETNLGKLLSDLKDYNVQRMAFLAHRTPLEYYQKFVSVVPETVSINEKDVTQYLDLFPLEALKEVHLIPRNQRGRDTLEKTRAIFSSSKHAMFLTALDSISWVTNCRGFHMPFLSSFYSKALVTKDKVYVFLLPETPVSDSAKKETGLEFIFIPFRDRPQDLYTELERIQNSLHLEEVWYDSKMLNSSDFQMLLKLFGPEMLKEKNQGFYDYQSIKEPVELEQMKKSFEKADQAIYETINWVKNSLKNETRVTELDLYHQTTKFYQKHGAVEQSFNTIAGVGANASLIHYGHPSDEVVIKKTDMILLDSGGYFDGGWATDTTRTFLAGEATNDPLKKEIYTLVLKGLLAAQSSVFPVGAAGSYIDSLARESMRKKGYDYMHGTGHGVGIHVHEPGVRLSSVSQVPMREGQVVSIEPGIYLPGIGGVRLENIAYVKKHSEFENMLCFEPLVYIGFEPCLIDQDLLSQEEKELLEKYEKVCRERGTSF